MSPAPELEATSHLSGETLDLLLIGALPPLLTNAAKAHLDDCEPCRTRWRELNEDKRSFEEHVFARTLPKVVARSGGYPQHRPRPWAFLPVAAVATSLFVGLWWWSATRHASPSLEVYLERPGRDTVLARPEASVEPSDRLRFVVTATKSGHLLVAARDQAGVTRVYIPPGGRRSVRVASAGRLELASGVELEGEPGRQTVVAIFSEGPISADALEGPLDQLALGPGATVVTLPLAKPRRDEVGDPR